MKKILPYLLLMVPVVFGFIGHLDLIPVLPDSSNTWFSASGKCELCHNTHTTALRNAAGDDVSPVSQWRSTMLANASKDPFWRAKVKHEGLENPSHKDDLENVCTRCHAPMGMIDAFMNDSGNYTLAHVYQDDIGKDGISCTVCHQVSDFNNPGFSGQFDINLHKEIYGPYPNPVAQQMLMVSGYTPVHNDQINSSRLCGSCHTLFTNSVFANGDYTGETFVEQALYHEWENSIYPAQNIGCQSCHMPRIDEPVKITSRPLFLPGRQPFGLHTFTGGNLFMLSLLKDNHDALALTSGPDFLQMTIDRTREMLINETVDLSIDAVTMRHDTVYVEVSIQNKTGHKFPTGFPSRRAYLECLITQGTDTLFHSGKKAAHALTHFDTQRFEPHHQIIRDEQQVQIYEFVMGNTEGEVTTILERAHIPLKDNRMVPVGFRNDHQNYDTVQVVGQARMDADYFSANGIEHLTYAIPQSLFSADAEVRISLHYETVPESWLQQMFAYATSDDDIARFRDMYFAQENTAIEIASDTRMIISTNTGDISSPAYRLYPNPSNGNITVEGVIDIASYAVYAMDGKYMAGGSLNPWNNHINLSLAPGIYLFVIQAAAGVYSKKLLINSL